MSGFNQFLSVLLINPREKLLTCVVAAAMATRGKSARKRKADSDEKEKLDDAKKEKLEDKDEETGLRVVIEHCKS